MHIKKIQKGLLKKSFTYLSKSKRRGIDIGSSPLCFLTTWAKNPGNMKLNQFLGKKADYIYLLKNILSSGKNHDLSIFFDENFHKKKQHKIIISYSTEDNFNKQNIFFDYYFGLNSKDKRYTWFLISLDNFVPKKIDNNLIIISKKNKSSLSLVYAIKRLLILMKSKSFSLLKFSHYCWADYDYTKKINSLFTEFFDNKKIKKVLFNYECIPWQNSLMDVIKKKDKNIKVLGYLHCAPWPLQTDLIFRDFSLDTMLLSSPQQKQVLKKFLGWKKNKIKVIPSLRFSKKKQKEFNNYIFLPYNLKTNNNYYARFENLLLTNEIKIGKLRVRIHPLNKKSVIHHRLKEKLEKLITKNKNKFNKTSNNKSIFFGSATGVCVQALEEGTEIIHFPDNETDIFLNEIWTQIKIKQINNNIYHYTLKTFNKTFLVNFEKKKFEKYIQF